MHKFWLSIRRKYLKRFKVKRKKTVARVFLCLICFLIVVLFWYIFSSLTNVKESNSSTGLLDVSIVTLLRGPTQELKSKSPDTYYFEINAIKSYLKLVGPDNVIAFLDDEKYCEEIIETVGQLQCLRIPCR